MSGTRKRLSHQSGVRVSDYALVQYTIAKAGLSDIVEKRQSAILKVLHIYTDGSVVRNTDGAVFMGLEVALRKNCVRRQ